MEFNDKHLNHKDKKLKVKFCEVLDCFFKNKKEAISYQGAQMVSYQLVDAILNKQNSNYGMKWSWDCNFKLDYDTTQGIIQILTRIYPPHYNKDLNYQGKMHLYIYGKEIKIKKIIEDNLLDTIITVENIARIWSNELKAVLKIGK